MSSRSSHASQPRFHDERLLYVVLLLVLESVYGWALFAVPALRTLPQFSLFTLLMLAHVGLHLAAPRLVPRNWWLLPYWLVQAGLALAIIWLNHSAPAPYAFYLLAALAGQSVALTGGNWRAAVGPVAGDSGLGLAAYGWWWGWSSVPAFFVVAAPQAFFVVAFVYLFVRQTNGRRQAQALLHDLEQAHRELEAYAAQVEALTLVAERQRLARELHDTLAQGLASLIVRLEAVDAQLERGRTDRAQALVSLSLQRARAALAEARLAIDDLRGIESGDFAGRVWEEVERFRELTGVSCDLEMGSLPEISVEAQETLLRVVRESLTNVSRHAHASRAQVMASTQDTLLEVTVQDDGDGFDPAAIAGRDGHYGLAGLQERALAAGGILEITSVPGVGTLVKMRLPLDLAKSEAAHV
jgi:NarL family two-component system sensor histidine kinase YdfH